MDILVFSSCTKSKKFEHKNQPGCSDLTDEDAINEYINRFSQYSCKAEEMYRGAQHRNLLKGINRLQKVANIKTFIISAGLGIIPADKVISPYNCTFTGKSKKFIKNRSNKLNITADFQRIVNRRDYNLIYLALGKDYLQSIRDWETVIDTLTIAFSQSDNPNILSLGANYEIVHIYSEYGYKIHGVVGFKGDLLRIFAEKISRSEKPIQRLTEVLKDKKALNEFITSFLN